MIDAASREPLPIVFISGPSGSGKSTLVREVVRAAESRGVLTRRAELDVFGATASAAGPSVADLFAAETEGRGDRSADARTARASDPLGRDAHIDTMLAAMALAGLSDATLLARRPNTLSEGQRWRLSLAIAFARGSESPGSMLIADEFCSTLDRPTAWALCVGLKRAVERARAAERARTVEVARAVQRARDAGDERILDHEPRANSTGSRSLLSHIRAIVVATAHDDLVEALSPTWHVRLRLDGAAEVQPRMGSEHELA